MKKLGYFSMLVVAFTIISLTSCSNEEITVQKNAAPDLKEKISGLLSEEDLAGFNAKFDEAPISIPDNAIHSRSPITYTGQLCGDPVSATHATGYDWPGGSTATFDYYSFSGDAGDVVSINIARISGYMDPIAILIEGLLTDSDQFWSSNILAISDDVCNGGYCYADPCFSYTLPSTGSYTLAVADYFSCGSPLDYQITTLGISCTITIDGCDSGVEDQQLEGGSMLDQILDCAANAENHGQFVSCVAHLTNDWKAAGLISEEDKEAIMECAAESNLP